ncbi:MAG: carboxypeptidase regulatory-like domain-containing protein [Thermoanaerobaculia bacterium]
MRIAIRALLSKSVAIASAFACASLLSVAIASGATVSGSVHGPDGSAVAGARISAYALENTEARLERLVSPTPKRKPLTTSSDGATHSATAVSDAEGAFAIDVPATTGYELEVDADGFAPAIERPPYPSGVFITLRRAVDKTGRVTAAGKPVANATVVLRDGDRELLLTTDDAGRFTAPDPRVWAHQVFVFHPDFAPYVSEAGRPLPETFELQPGIEMRGRVTGAAVAWLYVDGIPAGTAAEDGTFVIAHAPKTWRRVEARAGSMAAVETRAGSITLALRPAAAIRGTLREEGSAPGIAGARVMLRRMSNEAEEPIVTITDARGGYRFERVLPDRYGFEVDAPGFAMPETSPDDYPNVDARNARAITKDMTLRRVRTLTGRVTDEAGVPVPGAIVSAAGASVSPWMLAGNSSLQSRTLADGTFAIQVLWYDGSEPMRVWAFKKGYAPSRSEKPVAAGASRPLVVNVTLRRGERVQGRVVDAEDAPVRGAAVASFRIEDSSGYRPRAVNLVRGAGIASWPQTDAEGRFEFQALPGKYDFAAYAPGFQVATLEGVPVEKAMEPVELKLARGAVIRGRVVRPDGAGAPGITIAILDSRSPRGEEAITTDSSGAFTIQDLPPGSWRLGFYKHEELISQTATVTAPSDDFVLELPSAGTVRGRVLDEATGEPVSRFQIYLVSSSGPTGRETRSTMREFNDHDGAFAFGNIPFGTYEATTSAVDYVGSNPAEVTVGTGSTDDLRIVMTRGVTLSGRVTDESGRPLAGANIGIDQTADETSSRRIMQPNDSVTGDDGEYRLTGLAPRPVTVYAQKQGWVKAQKQIDLSETTRLDLTLSRGVTLNGIVTSGGRGVAGAEVSAHSPVLHSESQSATTGASGEFTITGLLPYRYSIFAMKESLGRAELKDVDVRSAGRLTIELKTPETATIYGRVTGISPLEGNTQIRMVSAYSDTGSAQGAIDAAGNYRLDDAPTGEVRVTAHLQGDAMSRTSMQRVVDVAAGAEVQVDLEFARAITVTGRVTRGGLPFARAYVSFAQEGIASGTGSAVTSADGTYEIALKRGGMWRVMVHAPDIRAPYRSLKNIESSQTLDIDTAELTVDGRVVDAATGNPVAGATALLVESASDAMPAAQVETGTRGEFSLMAGAAGMYTLVVEKRGYGHASREISLERSVTGLAIELTPSDGASLRLVDARNGAPLSGVLLVRDSRGQVAVSRYQSPRADGAIPLALAPGRYDVTALVYGFATRRIQIDAPSPTIDIALTPGGTLRIESARDSRAIARLIGPDGQPYIPCCEGSPLFALEGRTTRIPNLLPGAYRLEIIGDNGSPFGAFPVTIAEGGEGVVRVE